MGGSDVLRVINIILGLNAGGDRGMLCDPVGSASF